LFLAVQLAGVGTRGSTFRIFVTFWL